MNKYLLLIEVVTSATILDNKKFIYMDISYDNSFYLLHSKSYARHHIQSATGAKN